MPVAHDLHLFNFDPCTIVIDPLEDRHSASVRRRGIIAISTGIHVGNVSLSNRGQEFVSFVGNGWTEQHQATPREWWVQCS